MSARLVTVTLNPALDVSTSVEAMVPSHKLRADDPAIEPGGGGINVSRMAARLGAEADTVVVLGGSTGTRLEQLAEAEGLHLRVVPAEGETRQSIAVFDRSTEQLYRVVLPGAPLTPPVIERCAAAVAAAVAPHGEVASRPAVEGASAVVVSGSLPTGSPENSLPAMIAAAGDAPVIVDTSGEALRDALDAGVSLIKPSARELGRLAGRELDTEADVLDAALEVMAASPTEALAVSIGAGGAFLVRHDQPPVRFRAPAVKVASTVGAGDSMVAAIAVALAAGDDLVEAMRRGVATGTAAVLTAGSALADPAQIDRLYDLVVVEG